MKQSGLFLGIVAVYSLFMASIRLMGSPVIGVDDVVEILFSQQWRLVYDPRQPPLYTWMLTALTNYTGPGLLPVLLLKYSHLILIAWIGRAIALRISPHLPHAHLIAFSLVLLWQIGWNIHEGVTHTLPLIACCLGTIWLLLRIAEEKKTLDWILLGIVISLGMLSKYSYLVFLLAVIVAILSDSSWRRSLVKDCRLGLTIVIAAGLVTPYGLVWVSHGHNPLTMAQTIIGNNERVSYLFGVGQGMLRLAGASLGFLSPLIPILCILMPRILQPYFAGGLAPLSDHRAWAERLLGRIAGAAILLAISAILFLEARVFKERWMYPLLITVPFWLWARAERLGGLSHRKKRIFCILLLVTIGLVSIIRFSRLTIGPPLCSRCRLHAPYQELIEALKKADMPLGSILADNEHIAGNLRAWLPQSYIVSLHDPWFQPPTSVDNSCLWIWHSPPSLPEGLIKLRASYQIISPVHQITLPAKPLFNQSLNTLSWTWSFAIISTPCSTIIQAVS